MATHARLHSRQQTELFRNSREPTWLSRQPDSAVYHKPRRLSTLGGSSGREAMVSCPMKRHTLSHATTAAGPIVTMLFWGFEGRMQRRHSCSIYTSILSKWILAASKMCNRWCHPLLPIPQIPTKTKQSKTDFGPTHQATIPTPRSTRAQWD